MENFKVEHFNNDNSEARFPEYRSLLPSEAQVIYHKLVSMFGIDANIEPSKFVITINDNAVYLRDLNANDSGFSLIGVLDHLNIKSTNIVYVNWYQYDEIDEMALSDLNRYFEYIWYPGADDIDIFDSTLYWLLSISHDGNIKFTETHAMSGVKPTHLT
jgi:hypothetical protein